MKRLDALRDLVGRHIDKAINAKLAEKYEGPYEVVEILSPTVYVQGQGEVTNRRLAKVHVSRIKRYISQRGGRQIIKK